MAQQKSWQFKRFTIPHLPPDHRCRARMWNVVNGKKVEAYCEVEAGRERCPAHDVNKKRATASTASPQRSQEQATASPAQATASPEAVWEEVPVDVATFCRDFLQEPLFPKQLELAEALVGKDPLQWDTAYTEALALWGMGSGKSKTAAKIVTFLVYKLLCLSEPQRFLRLGIGDKIDLVNVAPTAYQAESVFFRDLKSLVASAKNPNTGNNWFEEHGLDLKRDIKAREITFPKQITAHSRNGEEFTAIGLTVLLAILDEVGAFDPLKAKDLYDSLKFTARSRFPKHLKLLLLSYKYSDTDFLMTRFQEAERETETFRSGPYATWEVNPKLSKEHFIAEYAQNRDKAQRVYECTGTTPEHCYFADQTRLLRVLAAGSRENPIVGEPLGVNNLRSLSFKRWFQPGSFRYFIHVDLAKGQTGAGGLAMGHFDRAMVATGQEEDLVVLAKDSGQDLETLRKQYSRKTGGVVIDLVLQLKAPPGREILLADVESLIVQLTKKGWRIARVTADWWQSVGLIQSLRRAGIDAQELSVDRTIKAYETLKVHIYQGTFACYPHRILRRELEELIVTPAGKVDHPPYSYRRSLEEDGNNRGSKDVADAVTGCTYLCTRYGMSNFGFGFAGGPWISPGAGVSPLVNPLRRISKGLVRRGEIPTDYFYGTIIDPTAQPDKKDEQGDKKEGQDGPK